jgi:hypothetical protein
MKLNNQHNKTVLAPAVLPPAPQHLDFRCIHRLGGNIAFFIVEKSTLLMQ